MNDQGRYKHIMAFSMPDHKTITGIKSPVKVVDSVFGRDERLPLKSAFSFNKTHLIGQ